MILNHRSLKKGKILTTVGNKRCKVASHFFFEDFHTIKHSKAVLSGGRQGFAGGVQLVTIVTNADLKLDWLTRLLEHAGTVKHSAQGVLPPPLVFLYSERHSVS